MHRFVLGAWLALQAFVAIAQDTSEPSATVDVSPTRIPPGGTVNVSGIGFAPNGLKLLLTVTLPDGGKTDLAAVPDGQGRYSVPYIGPQAPGDYDVAARVGDKGVAAHAHFTVRAPDIDIGEDIGDNRKLRDAARDLVDAVRQQLERTPDSPAKSGMLEKLAPLQDALQKAAQQPDRLQAALEPLLQVRAQAEDGGAALQPMFDHLAQLDEQTRLMQGRIEAQVRDSRQALADCDRLDQMTQSLRILPQVLNLLFAPVEFIDGFMHDMALADIKSEIPDENGGDGPSALGGKVVGMADKDYKLGKAGMGMAKDAKSGTGVGKKAAETIVDNAWDMASQSAFAKQLVAGLPPEMRKSEGFKFVVADTKKYLPKIAGSGMESRDLFKIAVSVASDAIAFASDHLFAAYCEKFEGPFTATMKAQFFAQNHTPDHPDGNPWWTFGIAIKGKLTLRYPKHASGEAVALSGQFEGGATRFTYSEDVWHNSDLNKIVPQGASLVGTRDVAPFATDDASGGVIKSLTSPTAFYIPVAGQYANGRVSFALQDARTDFDLSLVKAHTFFVVISPYTLFMPVMSGFSLPYKDAHWVLDHYTFDYPVTTEGDHMLVQAKDSAHKPANQNVADYRLDLKLCNPACEASGE